MRVLAIVLGCAACKATDESTPPSGRGLATGEVPITNPAAPCSASVVEAVMSDVPNPLARQLDVTLDANAALWTICRPEDDPDEALLFESGAPSVAHRLDITGLYAGTSWSCTITPACDEGSSTTVPIEPTLSNDVPGLEAIGTPSGAWTLVNSQKGAFAQGRRDVMIVDPQGRMRWQTLLDGPYRADIDTAWTGQFVHIGGGWGLFEENLQERGLVLQLDLAGRVLLERNQPAFGEGYNHHCEVMSDGEILSLTGTFHQVDDDRWSGIAIERLDPATDTVTWSWDSHDLVDSGVEGPFSNDNPWNGNALVWTDDPAGEAVWVSLYTGQAMWRIDPATGQRTHVLDHHGDFTFVDPNGEALPPSEWVYGQHGPDIVADGRMVLFDNGVGRPGGDQSRVVEWQLDLAAQTATLLWQWTEPDWYTPILGDADYLPSGNLLVTKGVVQALTPFQPQQSAVIELDPTTDEVRWRLQATDQPSPAFYRAQQYDGCAIFRSARHCNEVVDRITFLTEG